MHPDKIDLIIVNMPFGAIQFPSIQMGLLKAICERDGFVCEDVYANLEFARLIGPKLYDSLAQLRGTLIGEWLFTEAAFPGSDHSKTFLDEFGDDVRRLGESAETEVSTLIHIRERVAPDFVQKVADDIGKLAPRAVGFTSTFEQNVASLSVARLIKERYPDILTVFGGANYDGDMGFAYFDAFPRIDIVVSGEADSVLAPMLDAVRKGDECPNLPGILDRRRKTPQEPGLRATYSGAMNDLPTPRYESYFSSLERLKITPEEIGRPVYLPIESSRGCWWGQKHHCTFCGLNANGMTYRSKTADTVIRDISTLAERHRLGRITAVDNIISLPLMKDLTHQLADQEFDYELFYEIKANLSREQIRDLRNGGITHVQPGIESLSTNVLRLMRKGITSIRNVNALRWLRYYDIEVLWNIIYGFPGETPEDYRSQNKILELLAHLQPPKGVGRIWLERFSPYFTEAQQHGFRQIEPERSFVLIYPPELDYHSASYFFNYEVDGTISEKEVEDTKGIVDDWIKSWKQDVSIPYLHFAKIHSGIRISDGRRDPKNPQYYFYKYPLSLIYTACVDGPTSPGQIQKQVSAELGSEFEQEQLWAALDNFVRRGLMMEEDGVYLSLALPSFRAMKG